MHTPTKALAAGLVAVALSSSCTSPVEPPTSWSVPPDATGPGPAVRLVVWRWSQSSSLIIRGRSQLVVLAYDSRSQPTAVTEPVQWSSSDPAVASVSSYGVATGVRRGTVTIVARAMGLEGQMDLDVHYRVSITNRFMVPSWEDPYGAVDDTTPFGVAAGDTMQFSVSLSDGYGVVLEETPLAEWTSSSPEDVSVSANGLVVGHRPGGAAKISVMTTADGADTRWLEVDAESGQPATVRYTHGASGLGPITFVPSRGAPVTLAFGESVERFVGSGHLYWLVDGLPGSGGSRPRDSPAGALVREGDQLSLVVTGDSTWTQVLRLWARPTTIASNVVAVRLVVNGVFGVIYHVAPDAPAVGVPWQCYFDGGISDYFVRDAGDFDFVLKTKFGEIREERLRASVPAGRAATLVVTGDTELGLLMLLDP